MVIFDDLHKLLLYQRLNLGFECHVCKKKFLNSLDHLQHTSNCKEQIKCPKCDKTFGHHQILHLHMQFHYLSQPKSCQTKDDSDTLIKTDEQDNSSQDIVLDQETRTSDVESVIDNQIPVDISKDEQEDDVIEEKNELIPTIDITDSYTPKKRYSHKNKSRSKAAKKKIGLTKVKMEDCLRCDECSCIYLDEKDYYKHMRNFHQLDVNNMPIIRQNSRTKRKCRSCCKQCRGVNCSPVKRPRATQSASNLIFKINMRDNIKNRWTKMVSSQISEFTMPNCGEEDVRIKPDPDMVTIKTEPEDTPDLTHLLSQVEVKIKTEPVDDYNI